MQNYRNQGDAARADYRNRLRQDIERKERDLIRAEVGRLPEWSINAIRNDLAALSRRYNEACRVG